MGPPHILTAHARHVPTNARCPYLAVCREGREALTMVPASLEQLADLVNLHRRLADERRRTEARFEPLRDKYKLLERYEVGAKEEEAALLESLEPSWGAFQALLDETAGKLEKYKDNFRCGLRHVAIFSASGAGPTTRGGGIACCSVGPDACALGRAVPFAGRK